MSEREKEQQIKLEAEFDLLQQKMANLRIQKVRRLLPTHEKTVC